MAETQVDDELWNEFHRVVNMSSHALRDWLRTEASGAHAEREPDRSGPEIGRQVLAILGKRRTDLTADDVATMRYVVDEVTAARRADLEPVAGDAQFRHRLMSLGHDPLQAP
ncbi:DUF3140 domain-containing protein [Nocardia cyriacigeorgica]|uniref:DUF3140 domain-containing protein n=1 Tax=Nocardia cyriacigeorgica TaxID=135487 RepID=UPI0013D85125|nr:DUF3140 domain-containing protein [Nocardia cyriacigeorgica]MBF6440294.1 DUF3140 domain-containing protein [Nocardia cyriacigeorgica]MBF6457100.1 DUF3140 domain-containing protein [Nocardia cyriacigeorgica]MBF6481019.1 DUF3140 domain-containing protein [Nocardia cyriacigeorgica]MBF6554239.1 DUF3140 domain-containing protein [Nocardia cyriacigeorgica]NEW26951.1 DUF3140 domain-containing protein [Nocardia cyriacigeorgica]